MNFQYARIKSNISSSLASVPLIAEMISGLSDLVSLCALNEPVHVK